MPDAATALKVAEPILVKTYGSAKMDYERPFSAELVGNVWFITGTLCCPNESGRRTCERGQCLGGVARLKIRREDGKLLSVSHGK